MKWYMGNNFPDFDDDGWLPETWNKLKEPGMEWMNLLAIPVGVLLLGLIFCVWSLSRPEVMSKDFLGTFFSRNILLIMLGIIVPHEFIHLIFHPAMGRTRYSVVGFIPKYFLFFAAYTHEWSCRRFAICLAAPLLCISVVPPLLALAGLAIPPVFIHASLVNAFFASGDVIGLILLVTQVPPRALVRNRGTQSYWTP